MTEQDQEGFDELFDSLTPYEIAVLSFTSPPVVEAAEGEQVVVLTGKEAYLWAGTVAHTVIRKPELSANDIVEILGQALRNGFDRSPHNELYGVEFKRRDYYDDPVLEFLRIVDLYDERDLVYRRTEDAVRSLIWRGHIEDPFRKKVGAAILSVMLTFPVGFTSDGPDKVHLDALTWEYVQRTEHGQTHRQLRLKVKEVSDVVLNKIVPTAVGALDKLSGTADAEGMTNKDVQIKLAQLGYYTGQIDGHIGPKTITALRRFQHDQYLEVTGYLDSSTTKRLKSA